MVRAPHSSLQQERQVYQQHFRPGGDRGPTTRVHRPVTAHPGEQVRIPPAIN